MPLPPTMAAEAKEEGEMMDELQGRRWLAAGFRATRKMMATSRHSLVLRRGIDEETRRRGLACYDAIIAEIDTQIRDLRFPATPAPAEGE